MAWKREEPHHPVLVLLFQNPINTKLFAFFTGSLEDLQHPGAILKGGCVEVEHSSAFLNYLYSFWVMIVKLVYNPAVDHRKLYTIIYTETICFCTYQCF